MSIAQRSLPHRDWMDDPRLSLRAKGILMLLCARGALAGAVSVPNLTVSSRDGEAAVRAGLGELKRAGYLVRPGRYYQLAAEFEAHQ